MTARPAHPVPRLRRGSILIVSIVVVFALASITLVLCRGMRVELIASANHTAGLQALTIERGAEQYLMAMLTDQGNDLTSITEDYFAAVPVGDGCFWVLRPDYGDPDMPVFGMIDEAAKLNINTATYDQLMMLPAMTDDVAAAIIDWRDEDEDISPNGAENEYYLGLLDPYYCKNATFETVEELLLVRGVIPQFLYGDGTAPPLGSASLFSTSDYSMLTDVWLQRGIFDLLTTCSSEPNTAADGTQRVNITQQQGSQLRDVLTRQLGESRANQIAGLIGGAALRDVFDLCFRAKLTATEFGQIVDYLTSSSQSTIKGRINVNTAPRDVLLTLPNLDSSDVDKLLSQRRGLSTTDATSIAWVADALGERAVGLGNRITGKPYQYSARILAASGNGRAFKQVRIVIDMSSSTPQVIYRRDLTDRGWPMEPQVLASLRAGQGPGAWPGGFGSNMGGALR